MHRFFKKSYYVIIHSKSCLAWIFTLFKEQGNIFFIAALKFVILYYIIIYVSNFSHITHYCFLQYNENSHVFWVWLWRLYFLNLSGDNFYFAWLFLKTLREGALGSVVHTFLTVFVFIFLLFKFFPKKLSNEV